MSFFDFGREKSKPTPSTPQEVPPPPTNELVLFDGAENEERHEPRDARREHIPHEETVPFTRIPSPQTEHTTGGAVPDGEKPNEDTTGTPSLPEGWEKYWGRRKEESSPNIAQDIWRVYRESEGSTVQDSSDPSLSSLIPDLETSTHPTIFDSYATEVHESLIATQKQIAAITKYIDDPNISSDRKEEMRRTLRGLDMKSRRLGAQLDILKSEGFTYFTPNTPPEEIDAAIRALTAYIEYRDDRGQASGLERFEKTRELLKETYEPFALKKEHTSIRRQIETLQKQRPVPDELFGLAIRQKEIEDELKTFGYTLQGDEMIEHAR